MQITRRPVTAQDEAFLHNVFALTRAEELAAVPWSEEQKRRFLDQQYDAQERDYRARWADATYEVVLADGRPVGRLWTGRTPEAVHVLDISLLPQSRGKGLGAALLREVQDDARATGRGVTIHVERHNPARRLYDRLGFALDAPGEVYDRLTWAPMEVG